MDMLENLLSIMARLRNPQTGCPWDIEQDFATIAPHTVEEAYEVADAIEKNDMAALKEELGDLLLQVVFHAQIANEKRLFNFSDIAEATRNKLVRRHPHIFGDAKIETAAQQTEAWEAAKAEERNKKGKDRSALADVPTALPALLRAQKLQKRAARVGFDWQETEPIFAKVEEELGELRKAAAKESLAHVEEEMGDLLFACVNLARHFGLDAETALRMANGKFERRFRNVEKALAAEGNALPDATLDAMNRHWDRAKREEKMT